MSHRGQLLVGAHTGLSYRWLTTYNATDYCGARSVDTSTGNSPVCIARGPFALDLELAWGATHKFDALLDLRIGLERDFSPTGATANTGPRQFHLAPGLRYFFSEGVNTKLFTTAQLILDFASYQDAAGQSRGMDFGLRNANGLWVDFSPSLSGIVYVAENLTFARWLRFDIEGGVGVVWRYAPSGRR